MKIHTTPKIADWVIEFPWGGKMCVAKRRERDRGLSETKLRALMLVVSSYELALRTSKKLLRELKNKRHHQRES